MTQSTDTTLDDSTDELTLVVDPDHIIAVMKRNARDSQSSTSHLLSFKRPLEGRVNSSILTHQDGDQWPHPQTEPLVLGGENFLADDRPATTNYPESWMIIDDAMEVDGVDKREDMSDETFDMCRETHLEIWESAVRNHLKGEVDINEDNTDPNAESCVVAVEYC